MTKKELIDLIKDYPDNIPICIDTEGYTVAINIRYLQRAEVHDPLDYTSTRKYVEKPEILVLE